MSMTRATVPHRFVANSILLAVELESDKGGGQEVGGGTSFVIQCARANPETNVAELELCAPWGAEVLTRPQKEVKTETQATGSRQRSGGGVEGGLVPDPGY